MLLLKQIFGYLRVAYIPVLAILILLCVFAGGYLLLGDTSTFNLTGSKVLTNHYIDDWSDAETQLEGFGFQYDFSKALFRHAFHEKEKLRLYLDTLEVRSRFYFVQAAADKVFTSLDVLRSPRSIFIGEHFASGKTKHGVFLAKEPEMAVAESLKALAFDVDTYLVVKSLVRAPGQTSFSAVFTGALKVFPLYENNFSNVNLNRFYQLDEQNRPSYASQKQSDNFVELGLVVSKDTSIMPFAENRYSLVVEKLTPDGPNDFLHAMPVRYEPPVTPVIIKRKSLLQKDRNYRGLLSVKLVECPLEKPTNKETSCIAESRRNLIRYHEVLHDSGQIIQTGTFARAAVVLPKEDVELKSLFKINLSQVIEYYEQQARVRPPRERARSSKRR